MSRLIFIFINILLLQDANADAQIQPVPPRPRPTVGMCHLEVLSSNGMISFGNNYQETANTFRLHVDDRKRRIKLKLEDIEVNEVAVRRACRPFIFKLMRLIGMKVALTIGDVALSYLSMNFREIKKSRFRLGSQYRR